MRNGRLMLQNYLIELRQSKDVASFYFLFLYDRASHDAILRVETFLTEKLLYSIENNFDKFIKTLHQSSRSFYKNMFQT